MRSVFLDAGYLLALELASDQHHASALAHWQTFIESPVRLVTTSFVLGEVVTFLNSRGFHAKAVEAGRRLRRNPHIEVVLVDGPLFEAGWTRFRQRPDKRYSLTDCVSFVVMEQRGLTEALAFDRHFAQKGFVCLPG